MRISIWQQFSSNHSSEFTVVGRFKTLEAAQKAEEQLRQWMSEIFKTGNHNQVTEIERKLAQAYDIEWYEQGIDWNGLPDSLNEVVRRSERDVFLICPVETWDSPIPFVELMDKLNAEKVDFAEGDWTFLCVHLKFVAPDEDTGQKFLNHTKSYLEESDLTNKPLWDKSLTKWDDVYWYGEIQKIDSQIELRMQSMHVGKGLPELIEYLEQNGFKNIEYTIFQDKVWYGTDWEVFNKPPADT